MVLSIEFDDRALSFYGSGKRHINFYDDTRALRASIYLTEDGRLNLGNLQIDVSEGTGEGSTIDLADVPFLAIAATPLLNNERVFAVGDGLRATDQGGGNNYTVRLGTPSSLSAQTTNQVTAQSHAHAITASSNPGANERILKSTVAGALTLQQLNVDNVRLDGNTLSAQSGDLTLTATGGDVVLPSAINIGADNFASQLTGWRVTYAGNADFRNIYADELHVKAFIADIEQALAGGQIISKSVALLNQDFVVPVHSAIEAIDTTNKIFRIDGDHTANINVGSSFVVAGSSGNNGTYTVASVALNLGDTRIFTNEAIASGTPDGEIRFRRFLFVDDLPGFADTAVFANNDWVRLRVIDRSGGGLVVADVWGTVTNYTDQAGGFQRWVFEVRDDGGVSGNAVNAGAIVLDYGASGDGWHEVTALDPDGPYSQIVTWATDPTSSSNYTLRSRLGNLDGVTDSDFPSIGGWGLYSTSAYLKGDLIAAGGKVAIDTLGINLDGALGESGPEAYIRWRDGAGGSVVASMGTMVDSNEDIDGFIINQEVSGGALRLFSDSLILGNASGGGALFVDSANNRVGIGTASPSRRLSVVGNVADYAAYIFNDGNNSNRRGILIDAGEDANPTAVFVGFRDGNGDAVGTIAGTGSGGVAYHTSSDARRKQDIAAINEPLGKVLALRPVTFRGRGASSNAPKRAGLIAQEVRGVLPELVVGDDDGMLSLDYMGVTPYLIGAVQELAARIDSLEAR